MAAIDYAELATVAQQLVSDAGRKITIISFNDTPADSDKPWRGAVDPRVNPADSKTLDGVFIEPSSATSLGMSTEVSDLLQRSAQIVIVATTDDLKDFNEIIDTDGLRWKIKGMEKLAPAETILLYFIGVVR